MYDVIIIGSGPAGLAAAVYLARHKLSFALIGKQTGGQVLWSADIENYLGFHLLNGVELVKQFQKHLEDYRDRFDFFDSQEVRSVERKGDGFLVRTDTDTEALETKTVLVASGTRHRALQVPGEAEFYGKGVTYCATCDAPLFRDKIVYVIGGGNSAMDAALFAEKYATRVFLVSLNAALSGDEGMKEKIRKSKNIILLASTKTVKILGTSYVTDIVLAGPDGVERTESADGVFVEIGLEPVSEFIDFVAKDKKGQIIVDKYNATSVAGIWAAGDVTDVTAKQIAVATGEGTKAALSIIDTFQRKAS